MTDKNIKEEIQHINARNQEYIAENNRMTDKQIIIDGCNVSNCKYYIEDNGVEYQGLYQYTNMCYKLPYDNCFNKRFCWHKIISKIKRIFRYGK